MARVWSERDVTCVHPGWPPINGRAAVLASYRGIMSNPNQPPVTAHEEQVIVTGDVARLICVEAVAGAQLIATNLFMRDGEAWRLIHHQASLLSAPRAAPQAPTLN
jgi:ketosteroid isomerase-like protein